MGTQRTTFAKLQRERAKKAKAAAKREKRRARAEQAEEEDAEPTPKEETPAVELMDQMADLHQRYDDGVIDFETFEEQKAELLERLALTAN